MGGLEDSLPLDPLDTKSGGSPGRSSALVQLKGSSCLVQEADHSETSKRCAGRFPVVWYVAAIVVTHHVGACGVGAGRVVGVQTAAAPPFGSCDEAVHHAAGRRSHPPTRAATPLPTETAASQFLRPKPGH